MTLSRESKSWTLIRPSHPGAPVWVILYRPAQLSFCLANLTSHFLVKNIEVLPIMYMVISPIPGFVSGYCYQSVGQVLSAPISLCFWICALLTLPLLCLNAFPSCWNSFHPSEGSWPWNLLPVPSGRVHFFLLGLLKIHLVLSLISCSPLFSKCLEQFMHVHTFPINVSIIGLTTAMQMQDFAQDWTIMDKNCLCWSS